MRRTGLSGTVVALTTGGLLVMGVPSALADGHHDEEQWVSVTGTGTSVDLSTDSVHAGSIHFKVSSTNTSGPEGGGSQVTLFKVNEGHDLKTVFRDLRLEFSQDPEVAAKGTRELTEDITSYGLADVSAGEEATATATLSKGTYYLFDSASIDPTQGDPQVTTLTVGSADDYEQDSDLTSDVVVTGTSEDRFDVSTTKWPAKGTFTWTNDSDTLHFAELAPVEEGTTDEEVQAFFDSGAQTEPDFLVQGPSVGGDVLTPGRSEQITYDLPKGTYVLVCFVADDETGMPHALMGMHKVVTLG